MQTELTRDQTFLLARCLVEIPDDKEKFWPLPWDGENKPKTKKKEEPVDLEKVKEKQQNMIDYLLNPHKKTS